MDSSENLKAWDILVENGSRQGLQIGLCPGPLEQEKKASSSLNSITPAPHSQPRPANHVCDPSPAEGKFVVAMYKKAGKAEARA